MRPRDSATLNQYAASKGSTTTACLVGRAHDEVVQVVPTAECACSTSHPESMHHAGFWLGHGPPRDRCPFKGSSVHRSWTSEARGGDPRSAGDAHGRALRSHGLCEASESLQVELDVTPLDRPWLTDGRVLTLSAALVNPSEETVDTTTDPLAVWCFPSLIRGSNGRRRPANLSWPGTRPESGPGSEALETSLRWTPLIGPLHRYLRPACVSSRFRRHGKHHG